ncbi:MAG: hypothetical protein M3271_00095, partial [Actinomycetota bacterium]|nr:hypothetical protein [Actinomycetota bacterium]
MPGLVVGHDEVGQPVSVHVRAAGHHAAGAAQIRTGRSGLPEDAVAAPAQLEQRDARRLRAAEDDVGHVGRAGAHDQVVLVVTVDVAGRGQPAPGVADGALDEEPSFTELLELDVGVAGLAEDDPDVVVEVAALGCEDDVSQPVSVDVAGGPGVVQAGPRHLLMDAVAGVSLDAVVERREVDGQLVRLPADHVQVPEGCRNEEVRETVAVGIAHAADRGAETAAVDAEPVAALRPGIERGQVYVVRLARPEHDIG